MMASSAVGSKGPLAKQQPQNTPTDLESSLAVSTSFDPQNGHALISVTALPPDSSSVQLPSCTGQATPDVLQGWRHEKQATCHRRSRRGTRTDLAVHSSSEERTGICPALCSR